MEKMGKTGVVFYVEEGNWETSIIIHVFVNVLFTNERQLYIDYVRRNRANAIKYNRIYDYFIN